MALNLRTIEPDLHRRLKLAAFSSGKALERFCLDALEDFLNANPKTERQSVVHGIVEQEIPGMEVRAWPLPNVAANSRRDPSPMATPKVAVDDSWEIGDPNESRHDPKSCRVYKCGMCASLKA